MKPTFKNVIEELMPVVWHCNRWLDRCVSEVDPMLIKKL